MNITKEYCIHLVKDYHSDEEIFKANIIWLKIINFFLKEIGCDTCKLPVWEDQQQYVLDLLKNCKKSEIIEGTNVILYWLELGKYSKYIETEKISFNNDFFEDEVIFKENKKKIEKVSHEYIIWLWLSKEEKSKLEQYLKRIGCNARVEFSCYGRRRQQ